MHYTVIRRLLQIKHYEARSLVYARTMHGTQMIHPITSDYSHCKYDIQQVLDTQSFQPESKY